MNTKRNVSSFDSAFARNTRSKLKGFLTSIVLLFIVLFPSIRTFGAEQPEVIADHRWMINDERRALLSNGAEMALQAELRWWARQQGQAARSGAEYSFTPDPDASDDRAQPATLLKAALNSDDIGSDLPFVVSSGVNKLVNNPSTDSMNLTTQSETSIAVFGQNVVVGFNDSNTHPNNNFSGYAFSKDGGSTFSDAGNIPPQANSGNFGDPVVVADSQGNFYYVMLVRNNGSNFDRIGVAKSVDGGQTFSAPVTASTGSAIAANDWLDKPWIAVDPDTDDILVVWGNFKQTGGVALQFSKSTNHGMSFTLARTFQTLPSNLGPGGAQIVSGINGEAFAVWETILDPSFAHIQFCEIPASGLCTAQTITDAFARIGFFASCAGQQRRVLNGDIRNFELPSIAVDRTNGINRGNIYVVWNQASGSDQSEIFFSRRAASGGAWLTPKPVKINSKDQFMPAIAVSNDGGLAVKYYSRELDANNRLIDVFLSRSSDAGSTFTHQRITTTSFDVPPINVSGSNFDQNFLACYMGDYNHIFSDGENFYLVWGDNRNLVSGRPDPDVFFTAVTTQPKTFFAQIVDGGGWKTRFLLTNLDKAASSQVRLELFKSDGTAFNVLPGNIGTLTTTINPSGTVEITTIAGASASVGWARLTTLTTARSGFSALSQFSSGGVVQNQAGFLPSLPFKRGVFLIERDANLGTDTAVAIANQSDAQSTTVTLTLRDKNGNQVGTAKFLSLAARRHSAQFITELFQGEVPPQFQGSLLMVSNVTNIAASVRSNANGAQNANFPVFSGTFPLVSYFADVVNGAGWSTDLGFANLSQTQASGALVETFTQSGSLWSVLPLGSSQFVSLSPNGSGFLKTIGGPSFQRGWARITLDTRFVGGFQVPNFTSGGQIDREAGDVSRVSRGFSQTFALVSLGVNTGYAISNDNGSSAAVTFELFDNAGTKRGTANVTLLSGDQKTVNVTDLFPTIASITGSVRISSAPLPVAIRVLRQDGAEVATYPVF